MSEDIGHKLTDEELLRLERRILKIYRAAETEAADIANEYFSAFFVRDELMRKAVENGELTEVEYKQWRLAQIGRGERWEAMRDKLAERMTNANEVAAAYMNDTTPGIYSLNRNYTAYTINQYHPDADFTLFDERTVRRLIVEQPDLMPSYPEKRAVERGIDLAFGKRQITAQVTSSILLGDSIPHMADKLQKRIVDMNRTSAIRAARTATTAAECAGRQDTYMAAEKMGISLKKEWMATLDARTRAEHGEADGQVVAVDAPFTVGGEKLMAPGDRGHGASGWNIYNCRCTTVAVIPGIKSSRQTYSEWLAEKSKLTHKMAAERLDWADASPSVHTKEELSSLERYAKEQGVNVYGISRFDGDSEMLREQIDVISSISKEYGIKEKLTISFHDVDADEFAEVRNRTIFYNRCVLRDRSVTTRNLNLDNWLAASSPNGIAAHEMGHIISRKYGDKGLEIAERLCYSLYGSGANVMGVLSEYISEYSVENIAEDHMRYKYSEIIPEVLSRYYTGRNEFSEQFVYALKETIGL